jgi:hypothetical protein
MKKLLDMDFKLSELKKKFTKVSRKNDIQFIISTVLGVVAVVGIIIIIVMKLKKNYECDLDYYEDEDFYDDDNDDFDIEDDDFEE